MSVAEVAMTRAQLEGMKEISLHELIAKQTRELQVPLNDEGDSFSIWWSPAAYTRDVHLAITAKADDDTASDPFEVAERVILPLVKKWSIKVDGEMWPITAENVASLGLFIIGAMTRLIMADMPNASDIKKASAGTSSTTT